MLKPGLTRFILASLVILYHLSRSLFFGEFAVYSFFIISGYWISLMYEKKYLLARNTLVTFYISRAWRILPVLYLCSLLAVGVCYLARPAIIASIHTLDPGQTLLFAFSNLFVIGYEVTPVKLLVPAWSLDIEMQFYLLFPVLYFFTKNNKKHLLILWSMLAAAYAVIFLLSPDFWHNKTVLSYLFLFVTGMYCYQAKLRFSKKQERWFFLVFLLIIASQYAVPSLAPYYRGNNSRFTYYHLLSLLLTAAAFPVVINSVHVVSGSRDRLLGDMSFLVYLLHWIWLMIYNHLIETHSGGLTRGLLAAGAIGATYASSYIIYKLFDRKIEKLRHRFVSNAIKAANTSSHNMAVSTDR